MSGANLDTHDVPNEKIEWIRPRTIFIVATLALAAYVLIPQLVQARGFVEQVKHANLAWAGAVFLAAALTYVGATIGLIGAVPERLPFRPVLVAQVASAFANRITPARIGGMATNVRFLQRRSIPASVAISAVGLNNLAGFVIHATLLTLFGIVAGASHAIDLPLPSATTTAIVVGVVILLSSLLMAFPFGRKLLTAYLIPAIKTAWVAITEIATSPGKLARLFAGCALVTLSYTAGMLVSLRAFGANLPIATATFVYLAGAAVASAAPTPGGVGATEAALVAAYTAVGVDAGVAFAAVLLFRLMTYWLPILPGYLALLAMQRSGAL